MSNLLTSPVGQIHFMAAENPTKEGKYTVKLVLDAKKDKEFLSTVSEINKAIVVTAKTYRGENAALIALLDEGKVTVEARSNYKPTVWDAEGNQLEEAPSFFSGDKGTAQMIVSPYKGTKGGSINLVGIIVQELKSSETNTGGDGTSRETRLAQLRAAVEAATKG
jgi:hypothetical protein